MGRNILVVKNSQKGVFYLQKVGLSSIVWVQSGDAVFYSLFAVWYGAMSRTDLILVTLYATRLSIGESKKFWNYRAH